jgi:iron complex outermembrane receptor protein
MNMPRAKRFPCGRLIVLTLITTTLRAQEGQVTDVEQLKRLPLEQILDVQIWTASRKEETASQTAAAVTVITQEDIRRSGVMTIADALRLSPGMHVARLDVHQWAVSARGFMAPTANKLLVLIDGRSVYTPLFSGVFWDVQDTLLEDIERIEVVRGPGATLWGANAVNGVVNVITKDSKATQGALITAGGGTEEQAFAGIRYGGKINEDAHYRVYAKGFDRDSFALPNGDSAFDDWKQAQGGFRSDWDVSDHASLTFQGDIYAGRIRDTRHVLSPAPPFAQFKRPITDVKGANLLGRWRREFSIESDLLVQAYYDHTHRSTPEAFGEDRHTIDFDFQHRFPFAERHDVIWGLGYDLTSDDVQNSYTVFWKRPARTINVYSGFIQDEITAIENTLRFTLGTKLEHNDYSGVEYQPSGRFLWTPTMRQTVWGAVSRAVRTPSRADVDVRVRSPVPDPALPLGSYFEFRGSDDFDPEELLAFELGYRTQPHKRVSFDLAIFYHVYDNLRSLEVGPLETANGFAVVPVTFDNRLRGKTYGIATAIGYQLSEWWRWSVGYTLLLKDLEAEPGSTDITGGRGEGNDPTHQFFIRSFIDLPANFEFDAALRYVDELPDPFVPSYLVLDLRLGWRPTKNWELAIVAQNLLDNQHPEFGAAIPLRPQVAEVEQSVYGKVTWRF